MDDKAGFVEAGVYVYDVFHGLGRGNDLFEPVHFVIAGEVIYIGGDEQGHDQAIEKGGYNDPKDVIRIF